MRRVTSIHQAGPSERFARTAFDHNVGQVVPVNCLAGRGQGTIVAVNVTDNRLAVEITIEVEDDLATALLADASVYRKAD